jgi:hypothetical protein
MDFLSAAVAADVGTDDGEVRNPVYLAEYILDAHGESWREERESAT